MIYANLHADGHRRNSLFQQEDAVHRHNPTYTPRLLREKFLQQGIELNTPDMNVGKSVAFDLHLEGRPLSDSPLPQYLLALENPYINPLNADRDYCQQFDRVFAWDVRLTGLPNWTPILIPHPMLWSDFPGPEERTIFSCLINANKAFKTTLDSDLYLERIKTIRWYERHAPESFELYGMGWNKSTPAFNAWGRLRRSYSRLKTRMLGIPPYPSYRGEVADKGAVLRKARFSYCYENSRDLSNYITEKVLDSLVHGCVPVYWGADNVADRIPQDCYIDRRQFADTAAVHRHLQGIDDEAYRAMQQRIRDFLQSEQARQFSSEEVMTTVVEGIVSDLKSPGRLSLSLGA